jgi:U4/U6 small nuclear ribonucleoprotein PRP31
MELLEDLESLGSEEEEVLVLPAGSRHALPPAPGGGGGGGGGGAAGDLAESSTGSGEDSGTATEADDDGEMGSGGVGGGGGSSSGGNGAAAGASRKRRRGEELPHDEALAAELSLARPAGGAAPSRGLASVARLRGTARYLSLLASVRCALGDGGAPPAAVVGPLDEWPEYRLLVSSTALIAACDDELFAVHRYLVAAFSPRFPQLASMVPAAADFVRCVALIGNETDLSRVDLPSVLPPSAVMVVTATGSTTMGPPLPEEAFVEVRAAVAEWRALTEGRDALLRFVETRMAVMAPNVAAMLGARVGAQLLACAGGLAALSRAPSCNVQVMGSKRRTGGGGGAARGERTHKHAGVIFECALVADAPHALQRRAAKTLAAKVVLAARLDTFGEGRCDGSGGAALLAAVAGKLSKWQEPPPPRAHKPLKAPDEAKKKRRGGRRARAMREKLGVTEVRKEANRLAVSGTGAHEYGDFAMGVEAGMLGTGATATGRLRVEAKAQKRLLGAGAAKRLKAAGAFGGGAAAGTLSTFDFTAPQGMEFVAGGWAGGRAPRSAAAGTGAGSVFDNSGTFSALPR